MAGLTPGSVIRGLGPWGPGLIDRYVNGRFSVHGEYSSRSSWVSMHGQFAVPLRVGQLYVVAWCRCYTAVPVGYVSYAAALPGRSYFERACGV